MKLYAYHLNCGYVEENGASKLWREGGVYFVTPVGSGIRTAKCFDTLREARRYARSIKAPQIK